MKALRVTGTAGDKGQAPLTAAEISEVFRFLDLETDEARAALLEHLAPDDSSVDRPLHSTYLDSVTERAEPDG